MAWDQTVANFVATLNEAAFMCARAANLPALSPADAAALNQVSATLSAITARILVIEQRNVPGAGA